MIAQDFLLEIGCEELPPATLKFLSQALSQAMLVQLQKADLTFSGIQTFATPRRLALLVTDLIEQQPPRIIERQGPSAKAAFDKDGTPTLACLGFARSCGVTADQLQVKETKTGDFVFCRLEQTGKITTDLLPDIVQNALKQLPIAKPMRWGKHPIEFVRPVHWVVMLYGKDIVSTTILGKQTTQETHGHRFHRTKPLLIANARDYAQVLMSHGMVIADFNKRHEKIRHLIEKAADSVGKVIVDEDLLDEVTAMVEWPVALLGQFKKEFLELPAEVLITSMKVHQRCFPLKDKQGELLPYFILVSNIESKDPKQVVEGNERVINARLAAAAFFYDTDLSTPLESRLDKLNGVIFQHQLGTLANKTDRVVKLTATIANAIEEKADLAKRAALLAKCDLVSEMVYEFPSLQGTMGYYYALHDKEPAAVAQAIKEHYQPRFSGDVLPASINGCLVALADRLDTIIGIFGINKAPTGDKDPFALRRAALGILRIIIEKGLPLDLLALLKQAQKNYADHLTNKEAVAQAHEFIIDRLRAFYQEQGIAVNIFSAVLANHPNQPLDFDRRMKAVQHFQTLPEAEALASANKRVSNILKKLDKPAPKEVDAALFDSEAERNLARLLNTHAKTVVQLYEKADYTKALSELASLKDPIDQFFNEVMVMVDDKKIRNNRLALLASLRQLFTQVADISLL
jgi:glycyl-tRNA synthetase beta chain